jgi:hypothetical protein
MSADASILAPMLAVKNKIVPLTPAVQTHELEWKRSLLRRMAQSVSYG